MKNTFLIAFALILFTACGSDDSTTAYKDYTVENDAEIQAYLAENELTAEKSSTGLYYIVNTQGTGEQPVSTDDVTVAYKGYFTDGSVFDESDEAGVTFNLKQVIPGWTEGITYFNEGGSGVLLIPSHLAYGSYNYNGIPAGSVLIFDISLLAVN